MSRLQILHKRHYWTRHAAVPALVAGIILGLVGFLVPSTSAGTPRRSAVAGVPIGVPAKVLRYAHWIVLKYDENGNEQLEQDEWKWMRGNPQLVDSNSDGVITVEEFTNHVARYGLRRNIRLALPKDAPSADDYEPMPGTDGESDAARKSKAQTPRAAVPKASVKAPKSGRTTKFYVPTTRLPKGLPDWFRQRDKDGDGQVTLAEYSPGASDTALREFTRYDRNRDGVVTPEECVPPVAKPKTKTIPTRTVPAKPVAPAGTAPSAADKTSAAARAAARLEQIKKNKAAAAARRVKPPKKRPTR